jgi:hypothetical protein
VGFSVLECAWIRRKGRMAVVPTVLVVEDERDIRELQRR